MVVLAIVLNGESERLRPETIFMMLVFMYQVKESMVLFFFMACKNIGVYFYVQDRLEVRTTKQNDFAMWQ